MFDTATRFALVPPLVWLGYWVNEGLKTPICAVLADALSKPTWAEALSAIGTTAAVIVALYYAQLQKAMQREAEVARGRITAARLYGTLELAHDFMVRVVESIDAVAGDGNALMRAWIPLLLAMEDLDPPALSELSALAVLPHDCAMRIERGYRGLSMVRDRMQEYVDRRRTSGGYSFVFAHSLRPLVKTVENDFDQAKRICGKVAQEVFGTPRVRMPEAPKRRNAVAASLVTFEVEHEGTPTGFGCLHGSNHSPLGGGGNDSRGNLS